MFQLRIDTVIVVIEISQISVVNKYSKAPDSGEAREVHPSPFAYVVINQEQC